MNTCGAGDRPLGWGAKESVMEILDKVQTVPQAMVACVLILAVTWVIVTMLRSI